MIGSNVHGRRLILLTQWFDPEPVKKGLSFAAELAQRGFEVEVVTGFPNYPGGKVYDGYRIRPLKRERIGAVDITRLALYPSHDTSRLGRVFNYVSFFLSTSFYLVFMAPRANVIYAYHPPITVGIAAALARILRRTPVVLDVQDMWPDTLRATGMIGNERVLRFIDIFCRWTWNRVDRIVVLSNGFRNVLIERGVPSEKIEVIYNWGEERAARPLVTSDIFADPSRFRVLFAGNMGPAQALDSVLEAARITAARSTDVDFCFLGSGIEEERLKDKAREMGLANVHFLPRVPIEEVSDWLAAADCLLVHLKADPLFAVTIPSKTQAYLSAGKATVMAVAGDAAELLQRSGGGVVVPPENPEALAEAVIALSQLPKAQLDEMGTRVRRFYDQHLSFEQGVTRFATLFNDVITAEAR